MQEYREIENKAAHELLEMVHNVSCRTGLTRDQLMLFLREFVLKEMMDEETVLGIRMVSWLRVFSGKGVVYGRL